MQLRDTTLRLKVKLRLLIKSVRLGSAFKKQHVGIKLNKKTSQHRHIDTEC